MIEDPFTGQGCVRGKIGLPDPFVRFPLKNQTMKCFLDLDGVLTDFDWAAIKLHNCKNPWVDPANYGKWGTEEMFGFKSKELFWAPMKEGFWSSLQWTKEGKEILALVEGTFGYENISLLTSPCMTPGSVSGKVRWINSNLPSYKMKFLIGYQKHFCANENTVLIDDKDKNVDTFRIHGGKALLVPRPWNTGYSKESRLVEHLTAELSMIKEGITVKTPAKVG
jgi:5'(3')-deoxyribonucleotidase